MANDHSKTFRSAVLHNANDLRIEKVKPQQLTAGHVAVEPKFCGICGSDLHFYFHEEMMEWLRAPHPLTGAKLPVPFGHEFAGVVAEIGEGCGGDLKVGDKVAIMPTITDGTCNACVTGDTNVCPQVAFMGVAALCGGMSERAVVPEDLVFKLPKSLDCDVGALIEPLAVAWHAITLAPDLSPSTTVFIIGAGPVGTAILLCLLAQGITNIVFSEPSPEKRTFVTSLGAAAALDPFNDDLASETRTFSNGGGVDIAFECAGVPNALDTATSCVRPKGTIVNVAVSTQPVGIGIFPMLLKEVTIKFSIAYTRKDFEEVIQAVGEGRLRPEKMITKRIKLEDVVVEGMEVLHSKDNRECKILIDMNL